MNEFSEKSKLLPFERNDTPHASNSEIILNNGEYILQDSNYLRNKVNKLGLRLFYSDIAPKFYLTLFFANLFVLINSIISDDSNIITVIIECSITLLFTLEIYITYILRGAKYYKTAEGSLDVCMLILCLCFILTSQDFLSTSWSNTNTDRFADAVELSLFILRFVAQSTRLTRFYIRHNHSKKLLSGYDTLPLYESN